MPIRRWDCSATEKSAMGRFGDAFSPFFLSPKTYNDEPVVHGLFDAITGAN